MARRAEDDTSETERVGWRPVARVLGPACGPGERRAVKVLKGTLSGIIFKKQVQLSGPFGTLCKQCTYQDHMWSPSVWVNTAATYANPRRT